MDRERVILLNAISESQSELRSALNIVLKPKSAKASDIARKNGNALFSHQKKHDAVTHEKIFSLYCESVALAPSESQELAFAYGNRSYFLLHIHKYEDCIKDIDKALKITCSDVLKAKLLCRKAECLKKLGFSNVSSILEMVQTHVDKVDGNDKIKLLEMIDGAKAFVVDAKEVRMSSKEQEKTNEVPLTKDYSSRVSINYSKKYGRHLVAARDYEPGDIIFHEKLYACVSDRLNTYCQYCLKPVWSSVPCSYCSWAMFCSEDCREKAWNSFHDIECSLFSHLQVANPKLWKCFMLFVRVLVIGIKETGSVTNLRGTIESVDKCTDIMSKGFFKNGELVINSIQNINSLSVDTYDFELVTVSFHVPLILISLVKYSKLKDEFNVKQVEDLKINEDIIFLGSFLIKMIGMQCLNGFSFSGNTVNIDKLSSPQDCENEDLMSRKFITTLSSLFNHSCFPTADWRYTDQNTLLIVALQPIKTDSQIFISYGTTFCEENLSARHAFLDKYHFTCDCQACVEAWPPIFLHVDQYMELEGNDFKENEIMLMENIINFKRGKIDESSVKKLTVSITKASNFKQPSFTYCLLTELFRKVSSLVYCAEPPSFDVCN